MESQGIGCEVLTEREAAKVLRISPRKLFELRRSGQIPFKKVGGQYRYLRARLIAFLQGSDMPVSEGK